jgi:hypothetical protein
VIDSQVERGRLASTTPLANLQPLFLYFFPCTWNFPILYSNSQTPKIEVAYLSRMVEQCVHDLHMCHISAARAETKIQTNSDQLYNINTLKFLKIAKQWESMIF